DAEWLDGLDDLARFYLWFMDVAGLVRPHVLGHSIGGWTAAEMATMSPGSIDRLILVAPAGLKPETGEILDVFYYPPPQLLPMTVHDPKTVPEWDALFGAPLSPAQQESPVRNREMPARPTPQPRTPNPRPPLTLEFPNRFSDREKAHANYQRYLTEYEFADQVGFDGLMVNEHHSTPSCVNVGVNMSAAILARTTRRAKILLLGNILPIEENPVRLAEQIAMSDLI